MVKRCLFHDERRKAELFDSRDHSARCRAVFVCFAQFRERCDRMAFAQHGKSNLERRRTARVLIGLFHRRDVTSSHSMFLNNWNILLVGSHSTVWEMWFQDL